MSFKFKKYQSVKKYRRLTSVIATKARENFKTFFIIHWLGIGGGLIAFLLLPWQQNVTGEGQVTAYSPDERRQEISALTDGRVKKWHVLEGQKIKKDQLIVELEDIDPNLLERLDLEKDAALKKLDAAKTGLETSKLNVDRQSKLFEKGLSATLAVEKARLNYNKYLVDEANALSEISRIQVKIARQQNQKVYSPIDGYLLKIKAGQGGQLVKQGEGLAVIVPDAEQRVVELLVNGNDTPLLSKGREVRLQFQGWPAVQFSGWPMVAVGTFSGKIGFIDEADDGMGHFRILVFPDMNDDWPDSKYLRQGVKAKGWILLDEVRIGYEMWRIFNGFPPSLKSASPVDDASNLVGTEKAKNDFDKNVYEK